MVAFWPCRCTRTGIWLTSLPAIAPASQRSDIKTRTFQTEPGALGCGWLAELMRRCLVEPIVNWCSSHAVLSVTAGWECCTMGERSVFWEFVALRVPLQSGWNLCIQVERDTEGLRWTSQSVSQCDWCLVRWFLTVKIFGKGVLCLPLLGISAWTLIPKYITLESGQCGKDK